MLEPGFGLFCRSKYDRRRHLWPACYVASQTFTGVLPLPIRAYASASAGPIAMLCRVVRASAAGLLTALATNLGLGRTCLGMGHSPFTFTGDVVLLGEFEGDPVSLGGSLVWTLCVQRDNECPQWTLPRGHRVSTVDTTQCPQWTVVSTVDTHECPRGQ